MTQTPQPATLSQALGAYRFAYLLSSNAEAGGPPHAVAHAVRWQDGQLHLNEAGQRTLRNIAQQPALALVWPPQDADGYTLIVDGQAEPQGQDLVVRPSRAVLHRSGAAPTPGQGGAACTSDCVELQLS